MTLMDITHAEHTGYLISPEPDANPHVTKLRDYLIETFRDMSDVEAIKVAGELIEFCRDEMLVGLGAIRRNATANAKLYMTREQIAAATNLSYAIISRLITESRGVPSR